MATPSVNERASRRSSATAARRGAAAASDMPDVLADIVSEPDEIDTGGPESAATSTPLPPTQGEANLSRQRVARDGDAGTSVALPMALPEQDLSRTILPSDLVMPKLKISQGLSAVAKRFSETRGKEGVPVGAWYHSVSGKDLGDTVYFIPVDMKKSRSMFVQGTGIVCRSFDLTHGEGNPGIECEGTLEERHTVPENERGCAFRLWKREDGRNTPPPCGVTYNFFGLIVGDIDHPDTSSLEPATLQLRSTNTPAAQAIITHVMQMGDGVWSNCVIELTLGSKSNTRGSFYTAKADFYDNTENLGARVVRRAKAFARQMGSVDLRLSIENDPDTD